MIMVTFFEHEITLEKIETAKGQQQFVELLAGENACPPEDCGGNFSYARKLETLEKKSPKSKEYREVMEECQNAANYGKQGVVFEPYTFSLTKHKRALNLALPSEASPQNDANMMKHDFQTGRLESQLLHKPQKLKIEKKCMTCGKEASKCCSRCKLVYYCSAECQTAHWKKEHKLKCSQISTPQQNEEVL